MSIISSLFLLTSLLCVITCDVYIVTPDDYHYYPNTTCHHCHNLQHYLLNVTKYFTSNAQLVFLPGKHYLHTDLIIQNVHNITLIGSMDNDTTPVSVICYHSSMINGIAIINSTIVTVKNFVIANKDWYNYGANFKVFNCYYIHFHNMMINMKIKGYNMMGETILSNITTINGLDITFDDNISVKTVTNTLQICNHTIRQQSHPSINIKITQMFYGVTITVTNSVFSQLLEGLTVYINSSFTAHENIILFNKVYFINNHYHHIKHLLYIQFDLHSNVIYETVIKTDKVVIDNCMFTDIANISEIIHCEWFYEMKNIDQDMIIHNCIFTNIMYVTNILLFTFNSTVGPSGYSNIAKIINTRFIANVCNNDKHSTALVYSDSALSLTGPIIIHGNTFKSIIRINMSSVSLILFQGYIEISENTATFMIQDHAIMLMQHVVINITRNVISYLFVSYEPDGYDVPWCYFQFFGSHMISNFRIIIEYTNVVSIVLNQDAKNINCMMHEGSSFYKHNPLLLYQQLIRLQGHFTQISIPFDIGNVCYCLEGTQKCNINQLGPIFPGQTLAISLCINRMVVASIQHFLVSTEMYDETLPRSHCKVPLSNKNNWITRKCTKFFFTVLSNNEEQCELFLYAKGHNRFTILYVQLQVCPMGFSFNDKTEKCDCDSSMQSKLLTILNCNINDRTILRPANSWISANTHNNSSIYHLTPNCPFHYCLPQSSHLNFSTPNLQCQFNRSGLMCGQCQKNLSTIFGSSNCQLCSNIYLLLIIPITIAGLLLVFILFCINLTVTDGTINAFIMYTNIIGINDHVFFTDTKHVFTPAYTFISLANLDLGIQTCFYNGMDDYAKMWLQLAFPFYLMFIATLLIITSRYSITVQRLTARRALPVLATLFLLSYTKILRTVSSVLFFYSTITHLPSKHATLVWSLDANVPLFGIKFTLLFIACLILFLVLVPFNIILLFTRTLSQFQFINKFKPLLDAYQGPYKHKFYYWTGLQLLIRAVFFGISALNKNTNLIIGSLTLSVMLGLHGIVHPFKNSFKTYQELLYISNLHILYNLTLSEYQGLAIINVMITLAGIQFIFIIIYHIITYPYSGVIRVKINHFINKVTAWISKFNKPSSNDDLQLHTIDIPEVTYNYSEFREPLIGQD